MKVEIEVPSQVLSFLREIYDEAEIKQYLKDGVVNCFRTDMAGNVFDNSLLIMMLRRHGVDQVLGIKDTEEIKEILDDQDR